MSPASRSGRKFSCALLVGLTVLMVGFSGCIKDPDQRQFDRGYHAFKDHDYFKAFLLLHPLAQKGSAGAQLLIAKMYGLGLGVPQDPEKSEMWTAKAVEKLSPGAESSAEGATERQTIDALTNSVDQSLNNLENGQPAVNPPTLTLSVLGDLMKKAPNSAVSAKPSPNPPAASPPSEVNNAAPLPEPKPEPTGSGQSIAPAASAKTADELTVQTLRDRANGGDREAVHLLIEAYRKSYYGLHPDPKKIAYWQARRMALRLGEVRTSDRPWFDKMSRLTLLVGGAALAIMMSGMVLFWRRSRHR